MKKHVLWLALAVAVFVIATFWWLRRSETAPEMMPPMVVRPPPSASPYAPPPNQGAPPKPSPILDGSVKEMVSALQDAALRPKLPVDDLKKKTGDEKAPAR